MIVDEARIDLVVAEIAVRQQRAQEGDVGRRPFQPERRQCPLGAGKRLLERGRMDDHLGEQGVEIRIGAIARVAVGVDAHAAPGRRFECRERAAARFRRAVGGHGLHIDAELDGVAARTGADDADLGQAGARREA